MARFLYDIMVSSCSGFLLVCTGQSATTCLRPSQVGVILHLFGIDPIRLQGQAALHDLQVTLKKSD